ncbi:hypothetical protein E2C01_005000 [Portunus trituberculatus]|uniref:Uncharacterized protein n=1 Tax=Portunus trituberculatus TaxID=210409 RepID=A0A5B7CUG1_PORTR|nr:hypothetical protein [Portunus trituberculatus]
MNNVTISSTGEAPLETWPIISVSLENSRGVHRAASPSCSFFFGLINKWVPQGSLGSVKCRNPDITASLRPWVREATTTHHSLKAHCDGDEH